MLKSPRVKVKVTTGIFRLKQKVGGGESEMFPDSRLSAIHVSFSRNARAGFSFCGNQIVELLNYCSIGILTFSKFRSIFDCL